MPKSRGALAGHEQQRREQVHEPDGDQQRARAVDDRAHVGALLADLVADQLGRDALPVQALRDRGAVGAGREARRSPRRRGTLRAASPRLKITTSPSLSGSTWRPTSLTVNGRPSARRVTSSPTCRPRRVEEAAAGDRLARPREHAAVGHGVGERLEAVADRARLELAAAAPTPAGRRSSSRASMPGSSLRRAATVARAPTAHVPRLRPQRGVVDHAVVGRLHRERGDQRDHHHRQRAGGQERAGAARERVLDAEAGGGGQPAAPRRSWRLATRRPRARRGRARARRRCSGGRRGSRAARRRARRRRRSARARRAASPGWKALGVGVASRLGHRLQQQWRDRRAGDQAERCPRRARARRTRATSRATTPRGVIPIAFSRPISRRCASTRPLITVATVKPTAISASSVLTPMMIVLVRAWSVIVSRTSCQSVKPDAARAARSSGVRCRRPWPRGRRAGRRRASRCACRRAARPRPPAPRRGPGPSAGTSACSVVTARPAMRSVTSSPGASVELQRLADAQAGLAREAALEQDLVGGARAAAVGHVRDGRRACRRTAGPRGRRRPRRRRAWWSRTPRAGRRSRRTPGRRVIASRPRRRRACRARRRRRRRGWRPAPAANGSSRPCAQRERDHQRGGGGEDRERGQRRSGRGARAGRRARSALRPGAWRRVPRRLMRRRISHPQLHQAADGRGDVGAPLVQRASRWRSAPSRIVITRSARAATRASWVTSTIVWPRSSCIVRSSAITSRALAESRLPVGSSASRTLRAVDQRAGDRDALLLAAGEPRGGLLGVLGDAERGQQLDRGAAWPRGR